MRILNLYILISVLAISACTTSKKIIDGKILLNENGEARLGNLSLYLTIPQDFEIYQVHGKEGYSGYNIFSKDARFYVKGEMVIWSGHPIFYGGEESKTKIDSATAKILDKQILWTVYKTTKGLYATAKSEYGFFIWATERKDVDRLIEVFATLKKK